MTSGPIMMDVEGHVLTEEDRQLLAHPLTGGVILFTRNFESKEQLRALVTDMREAATATLIVAVDQEGGRVQRFRDEFIRVPPMSVTGRLYDDDPHRAVQLAEDLGWLLACELCDVGVDLNFAPVLDLDHGCSEVIGDRAFHRHPDVVTQLGIALISGLHSGGVTACAKHFPGHGAVAGDSHHELPVDNRSRNEIDRDLIPFRQIVKRGVDSIMTAHLVATCEDAVPVSFSSRWLSDILRNDLGFKGVIFSDDLSMQGARCEGGITGKVTRALAAGCDFLPVCNNRSAVIELYSKPPAVTAGRSFEALRGRKNIDNNYLESNRYDRILNTIIEMETTLT